MQAQMTTLAEKVLMHASKLPEGTPLLAKELLHLGNRAAVDQALSRLARRGELTRAGRGLYLRPVKNRFGTRAPSTEKTIEGVSAQRGETIVPSGAAAANALGLTTQVPVREIYFTSGPSRKLSLGSQRIELRHAPGWKLVLPGRMAGTAIRALEWIGKEASAGALERLKSRLPAEELREIARVRGRLPTWLAAQASALLNGSVL